MAFHQPLLPSSISRCLVPTLGSGLYRRHLPRPCRTKRRSVPGTPAFISFYDPFPSRDPSSAPSPLSSTPLSGHPVGDPSPSSLPRHHAGVGRRPPASSGIFLGQDLAPFLINDPTYHFLPSRSLVPCLRERDHRYLRTLELVFLCWNILTAQKFSPEGSITSTTVTWKRRVFPARGWFMSISTVSSSMSVTLKKTTFPDSVLPV